MQYCVMIKCTNHNAGKYNHFTSARWCYSGHVEKTALDCGVIYKYNCANCKVSYIGCTKRYWEKRLEEHTHVSSLTGKPLSGGQIFAPQQHVRAEKCSSSPHVQRDNFEIIGRENNSYKPKLNGTLSSAPLYLFT